MCYSVSRQKANTVAENTLNLLTLLATSSICQVTYGMIKQELRAGLQMRHMPPWFAALCWIEIFVQLPFFFVAAYGFWTKQEWIRTPAMLYGVNVTSTMVCTCSPSDHRPRPGHRISNAVHSYYSVSKGGFDGTFFRFLYSQLHL